MDHLVISTVVFDWSSKIRTYSYNVDTILVEGHEVLGLEEQSRHPTLPKLVSLMTHKYRLR
jgi:hypothetical protein